VSRQRLDEELVRRGLYATRARARDAVLRGTISLNGKTAAKPSQLVSGEDDIAAADAARFYVSRAALKLLHALGHFGIDPAGLDCLDLGSSTGGFTQLLLERGARHVIAVDVGHGQMEASLAADPRVALMEGLNARDLAAAHLAQPPQLIVCDVSFISLKLALPPALALAEKGAQLICLIKPQFEVGKGRNPHDAEEQRRVCHEIRSFVQDSGWPVDGLTLSPVKGSDGTQEFLLLAAKGDTA
jgi:23S rRNA (cytidine1920-2'-O)/16S rRNA (cytidine1409-2'-O)-methyltransferase